MKKYNHGMVFGKFMPMTTGHQRLFNLAVEICEKVTIVVCSLPSEPIDGKLRYEWIKKEYPTARVIHFDKIVPQKPEEDPNFWNIWKAILDDCSGGEKIDVLFGGEEYIIDMAETMGCLYVELDRKAYPISATMVRLEPFENWQYIPKVVRPYFVKKILVVGGMSTGKSTLTEHLADRFETCFVPEVARTYIEHHGFSYDNFTRWAWEHKRTVDLMTRFANKVLFVDTDAKTTEMYSRMYFCGKASPEVVGLAKMERYDFALLTTPDVPFEEEEGRDFPDRRWEIHGMIKDNLVKSGVPFVEISGTWDDRLCYAEQAVRENLGV